MNAESLAAMTKAEGRGSTFASLQTVGKLWPAGGKGFRRGWALGAELLQHQGQHPRSKPQARRFWGIVPFRSILSGFAAHRFPTNS